MFQDFLSFIGVITSDVLILNMVNFIFWHHDTACYVV